MESKNEQTIKALPRVLLLGNGATMGSSGKNWNELLNSITERLEEKAENLQMPMPLRAIYLTKDKIQSKLRENGLAFFGQLQDENVRKRLCDLLSLDFDEILTTNYSYELEMAASGKSAVTEYYLKKISKNIIPDMHAEPKYMLSTCNHVSDGKAKYHIWHIHGEARKPDSMILGHYYYAKILERIMTYLDGRKNGYTAIEKGKYYIYKSWIDSFILGDVYILGFGMDFSEFDLWWLLNRKKRENARHGTVRFFTPVTENQRDHERNELLKLLDVEVIEIPMKRGAWDEYYHDAIEIISGMLSEPPSKRRI